MLDAQLYAVLNVTLSGWLSLAIVRTACIAVFAAVAICVPGTPRGKLAVELLKILLRRGARR